MTITILDGAKMTGREEAHGYLREKLHFPDYYGKNLDALYDCLTEIGTETVLVWYRPEEMLSALGDYGKKLMDTVEDAAADNKDLTVYTDGE